MTDLSDLRIPVALRPAAAPVITLTDRVCADLLDEEYAALARHVVAKLARKRPSPLLAGRAATWAGGVVWALGQVNPLFGRSTGLYVAQDELAGAFGLIGLGSGRRAAALLEAGATHLLDSITTLPDLVAEVSSAS